MRKSLLSLVVLGLCAGASFAQGDPRDELRENPNLYPFVSFLDWTDNPTRDGQDRALGEYNFRAGFLGGATRALDRYPDRYDPARLSTEEGVREELQAAWDALLHNRPRLPYDHMTDAGHPAYMPDWNRNGTFGDPGDFDRDTDGDPHAVSQPALDTALFRYPCIGDGDVKYETLAGGVCSAHTGSVALKLGVAQEVKIVNSRGLVLDATLWLPGEAFSSPPSCTVGSGGACSATVPDLASSEVFASGASHPVLVFSNGLSSRQEHYYYIAMSMARRGYVVLTWDPAGQGESEGTLTDLIELSQFRGTCEFSGACRDLRDVVRWLTGIEIAPVTVGLGGQNDRFVAPRDPASDNVANPLAAIIERDQGRMVLAVAGNSMGAISTLDFLNDLGPGGEYPDSPSPAAVVRAAVSLSGATATQAVVPIQFQTSDFDGSPILVGPTVFGAGLGAGGEGIGYKLVKERYDCLRGKPLPDGSACEPQGWGPLELIVLEGGVHTDHVAVPFITRTLWANRLAVDYAGSWLDCHVRGDDSSCDAAVTAQEHLSRAFSSEQDPDGPSGNQASLCVREADRASLNQDPDDFLASYSGVEELRDRLSDGAWPCE